MDAFEPLDGLDFDDDRLSRRADRLGTRVKDLVSVPARQRQLPFRRKAAVEQLVRQACLVCGLRHSWTEIVVDGDGCVDDSLPAIVEPFVLGHAIPVRTSISGNGVNCLT